MRVCGVELKGSEAVICLLTQEADIFNIPDCRTSSFAVSNSADAESIKDFSFAFKKLMDDYQVERIVIIERDQKGKRAGSATSFKLEAAIQLCGLPVAMMRGTEIKEQMKRNPPQADFEGFGLKRFQESAFNVAYAYQTKLMYKKETIWPES